MDDPFLVRGHSPTAGSPSGRRADVWSPPQHPDVTVYRPAQAPEEDRGDAVELEQPMPVWVELDYAEIGHLKTHGFAIAASDRAVLVDPTWQGRLQKVWVPQKLVTHRVLPPRDVVDREVAKMRRNLTHPLPGGGHG